jgi:hypothetical protein
MRVIITESKMTGGNIHQNSYFIKKTVHMTIQISFFSVPATNSNEEV